LVKRVRANIKKGSDLKNKNPKSIGDKGDKLRTWLSQVFFLA